MDDARGRVPASPGPGTIATGHMDEARDAARPSQELTTTALSSARSDLSATFQSLRLAIQAGPQSLPPPSNLNLAQILSQTLRPSFLD